MDLLVVGRVVGGEDGGGDVDAEVQGNVAMYGHKRCHFRHVFSATDSNKKVFSKVCVPMVEPFVMGYNTAVVFVGAANTNWRGILSGEKGLVPEYIEEVFNSLNDEKAFTVSVCAYEILGERVRDLFASTFTDLRVIDTVEEGWVPKDISTHQVRAASSCINLFKKAFSERITAKQTADKAAFVFRMLIVQGDVRSHCKIVVLPSAEALVSDPTRGRLTDGSTILKGPLAFFDLIAGLSAKSMTMAWNLKNASMLTKLIGDVFGDNCQTAVIAHLNSVSKTALPKYLQLCSKMQKIRNFPVVNLTTIRLLLEAYRVAVKDIKGSSSSIFQMLNIDGDVKDVEGKLFDFNVKLLKLQDENGKLNDRLVLEKKKTQKLEEEVKVLNTQLLREEEDKLLVSKALLSVHEKNNVLQLQAEKLEHMAAHNIEELKDQLGSGEQKQEEFVHTVESLQMRVDELEDQLRKRDEQLGINVLDENFSVALRAKISKLVKSKIALIKERDMLVEQVVAMKGHPRSHEEFVKTTQAAVEGVEREGEEFDRLIENRTSKTNMQAARVKDSSSSSTSTQRAKGENSRQLKEMDREMRILRKKMQQLEQEKAAMHEQNKMFIASNQRKLTQALINLEIWMETDVNSLNSNGIRDLKRKFKNSRELLEESHKEELALYEKNVSSLNSQIKDMETNIARMNAAHKALRDLCESNNFPVPSLARIEETHVEETEEVVRLRRELLTMQQMKWGGEKNNNSKDKAAYDLAVFTESTQRKLEEERSQLIAAKAKAEKKLQLMEEFIRKRLGRK
eukprot:m.68146 g.68146  ORF g.68146 m.68146 type:complete len:793 (+) comp11608_c0_seq6:90-2468(+)